MFLYLTRKDATFEILNFVILPPLPMRPVSFHSHFLISQWAYCFCQVLSGQRQCHCTHCRWPSYKFKKLLSEYFKHKCTFLKKIFKYPLSQGKRSHQRQCRKTECLREKNGKVQRLWKKKMFWANLFTSLINLFPAYESAVKKCMEVNQIPKCEIQHIHFQCCTNLNVCYKN